MRIRSEYVEKILFRDDDCDINIKLFPMSNQESEPEKETQTRRKMKPKREPEKSLAPPFTAILKFKVNST